MYVSRPPCRRSPVSPFPRDEHVIYFWSLRRWNSDLTSRYISNSPRYNQGQWEKLTAFGARVLESRPETTDKRDNTRHRRAPHPLLSQTSYKSWGFPRDVRLLVNALQGNTSPSFKCHKPGRTHTQAGIPATLLEYARDLHRRVSSAQRLIAKFTADAGCKGLANIEEGVGLEDLREHADVLEVDDADFVRVEEEVVLLDVGVVDAATLPERGQELLQNRGERRCSRPEKRRLWERNDSTTNHENGQVQDSNL